MKLNRKILGLAIALIMLFSSTIPAFAAMPIDTVIVENKAYDFEYFQNNAEAILDVQAALDAGENVYVKFDGGILNVVINEFLENSEELPEVEYYDKDGNVTRYEAGDGDPVESEFKVIEISAIEDITVEFGGELVLPKTVKATLDNEEATEVTLAIEWAENEEFDAEVAGDYTFTGTLSKVEGEEVEFTIPEDKATVTVKVTVEEEVVEALRVESVSAITTNVDSSKDKQMLGFTVNNGKVVTLKELADAGYTVEFKVTADVLEGDATPPTYKSTTGELDESKLASLLAAKTTEFKYQVVITKAGETIEPSELATVKIENYSKIVEEITEVKASVNSLELANGNVGLGDTINLSVKGLLKGAEKADEIDAGNLAITVDKPAILSVAGKTLTANAKGTAVVTIKAGELTETLTFVVGDARDLDATKSTIDKTNLEIAVGKTDKVTLEIKDQYGLAYDAATIDPSATQATDAKGVVIPGKYEITINAAAEAGTTKQEIKLDGVKFAEVTIVTKKPGDLETYELSSDIEVFDLKAPATATISVKGLDAEGLEVDSQPAIDGVAYKLKVNETLATVANNDEVTLKVAAKAGDIIKVE